MNDVETLQVVQRALNREGRCATCGYGQWFDRRTSALSVDMTCMSCGESVTILPQADVGGFVVLSSNPPQADMRARWEAEGTAVNRFDVAHAAAQAVAPPVFI